MQNDRPRTSAYEAGDILGTVEPYHQEPNTDAPLRWGITTAFLVFGVGVAATAVLPEIGLVIVAGVLLMAIGAGVLAYCFAMGRA